MNHGLSFITLMVISGYAVFQANNCSLNVQKVIHRPVVAVLCFGGGVLLSVSVSRGCGRLDHECYRVSEHHCGPVAPLHGLCFSNWKWNVPAEQRPMLQGLNCVGVVPGT
ncbi:uncharacterized protein TNCV_5117221 [Trichonephila clavipes]|nr:uncharacterized protein TNCV_5117221 [Trichonephila clavipes]